MESAELSLEESVYEPICLCANRELHEGNFDKNNAQAIDVNLNEEGSVSSMEEKARESCTKEEVNENILELDNQYQQNVEEGEVVFGISGQSVGVLPSEIDFYSDNFLEGVAGTYSELHDGCFWKGCKWSPDGLCILTNSDDNALRIFNLPQDLIQECDSKNQKIETMSPELKMKEGEIIYDYDWYPFMSSYDSSTCCLISTSKDHPVHLWDAFTGHIRCSYLSFNHLDELVAANSLSFNLDGSKIYCGYNKMLRIFDSSRPGRECDEYPTVVKNSSLNQSGIISCISFANQISDMFALGSFAKSVGVYSEHDADLICMLPGSLGGVTQVQFSKDGILLFAGARRDDKIVCWDLRNPNEVLFSIKREAATNQKIQFDIHRSNRYLFTGNTNGKISVYDITAPYSQRSYSIDAHNDAVNGLSLHPYLPLVASTSGQRHFALDDDSSSSENDDSEDVIENSLRIWKYRAGTIAQDNSHSQ